MGNGFVIGQTLQPMKCLILSDVLFYSLHSVVCYYIALSKPEMYIKTRSICQTSKRSCSEDVSLRGQYFIKYNLNNKHPKGHLEMHDTCFRR